MSIIKIQNQISKKLRTIKHKIRNTSTITNLQQQKHIKNKHNDNIKCVWLVIVNAPTTTPPPIVYPMSCSAAVASASSPRSE